MAEERRRVTLSKAQCETETGRALMALLTELSDDGQVSREEMERLRGWLEKDHGVDFAALPFLYEVIDQVSVDGEVSEEELDRLATAIERVLPKEIRQATVLKRRQAREARRTVAREAMRREKTEARKQAETARETARRQAGIIFQADFPVRGAFRSAERREACRRILEGDRVTLEREPDNAHDANAIIVLGEGDCELGYVPREESEQLAPLLDAGTLVEATVRRVWETPESQLVPILQVRVRRGDTTAEVLPRRSSKSAPRAADVVPAKGCATSVLLSVLIVFGLATAGFYAAFRS